MIKCNDNISYKILDNGYEIYLDGVLWITQYEPYAKLYDKNKSYEENCLRQIEELTDPPMPDTTEQRISDLEDAVIELASLVG